MNNINIEPSINNFKCGSTQRRKLENPNFLQLTKEQKRKLKINQLKDKYFSKISNEIIKATNHSKNTIHFYYNYYDFLNNGLGKPHGFLNEFMMEMSYLYSEYASKDSIGNIITFKTLFGENFKWELRGKNMMIISW